MIRIRESIPSDNDALLSLTRRSPMDGRISLRIDRDPDFYALNALRGECKTFVAVDASEIVGCLTMSLNSASLGEQSEKVGYFADLKVLPAYRGGTTAYRLMKAIRGFIQSKEADIYICVIADGNHYMSNLLGGRASLPPFLKLGSFRVYSILSSRRSSCSNTYRIERLDPGRVDEVREFVNRTNAGFLFAPVLSGEDFLNGRLNASPFSRTLIARYEGQIVATATVFDASRVKSNVLLGLPLPIMIGVRLIEFLGHIFPIAVMPREGEAIKILYLRHVAGNPMHPEALRMLILEARKLAFQRRYSFVTVGFHERDWRTRTVSKIPKFQFVSNAYALSLSGSNERLELLRNGIPVEDFAMV